MTLLNNVLQYRMYRIMCKQSHVLHAPCSILSLYTAHIRSTYGVGTNPIRMTCSIALLFVLCDAGSPSFRVVEGIITHGGVAIDD